MQLILPPGIISYQFSFALPVTRRMGFFLTLELEASLRYPNDCMQQNHHGY